MLTAVPQVHPLRSTPIARRSLERPTGSLRMVAAFSLRIVLCFHIDLCWMQAFLHGLFCRHVLGLDALAYLPFAYLCIPCAGYHCRFLLVFLQVWVCQQRISDVYVPSGFTESLCLARVSSPKPDFMVNGSTADVSEFFADSAFL